MSQQAFPCLSVGMPQAAQHLASSEHKEKMPFTAEQLHRMEKNRLAALEKKRKREEDERISKHEEARAIKKQKLDQLIDLLCNPRLGDSTREILEKKIEEIAYELRPIEAALKAALGEGEPLKKEFLEEFDIDESF